PTKTSATTTTPGDIKQSTRGSGMHTLPRSHTRIPIPSSTSSPQHPSPPHGHPHTVTRGLVPRVHELWKLHATLRTCEDGQRGLSCSAIPWARGTSPRLTVKGCR